MKAMSLFFATALMMVLATAIAAQTGNFTYQGRFTDGGTAASGTYDMQFKLFDGSGNQIGSTITNSKVIVSNGVFTVQLDYGAAAFPGADRFLELGVRMAGSGDAYTVLAPRQALTSTPYAIRAASTMTADTATTAITATNADKATKADSATIADTATTATNATQLGGVAANQYVQTNDSRLTDSRSPTPGSTNYIQNTNNQQAANFNINGNGTAAGTLSGNFVNAAKQYNLGALRMLSADGNNTFIGLDAGNANIDAANVTFVGRYAGANNTHGNSNTFIGSFAGSLNTTGGSNSFMGVSAGQNNGSGDENSFFGSEAGIANTKGHDNSFFGSRAGADNVLGFNNSFFGKEAGLLSDGSTNNSYFGFEAGWSTTGNNNSFFGSSSGRMNTAGFANSFFGKDSGFSNNDGVSNAFFGYAAGKANTSGSYNSFFGDDAGRSNKTGNANAFFGYQAGLSNIAEANSFFGENAGLSNTSGSGNTFVGQQAGQNNQLGDENVAIGLLSGNNYSFSHTTLIGAEAVTTTPDLTNATAIGYGAQVSQSNSLVLGNNANVGIGTTAPPEKLTVKTATSKYGVVQTDGTITVGTYVGGSSGGGWFGTKSNHSLSFFVNDGSPSMTIDTSGAIRVNILAAAGSTSLCRNASNQISTCSSSLRYKKELQPFTRGLSLLNQLKPITFKWKADNSADLGFGAEDIAKVEPLLVTRNEKGEVEGVKYDRITAVLVNAVKEQQAEIETQREQVAHQQSELTLQRKQIEELRSLVTRNRRHISRRRAN